MIERLIALSLVPLWVSSAAGSVVVAMAVAPLTVIKEVLR